MKPQNHFYPYIVILFAIILAVLPACEGPTVAEENTNMQSEPLSTITADGFYVNSDAALKEGRVFFNPQPEPPARIFEFDTRGALEGDWAGRFRDASFNGRLSVETLSSKRRGRTVHVVQAWTLHPPDPIFPVKISLKGVLNLTNGSIVLNGEIKEGRTMKGTKVHVRGSFGIAGRGVISVGGELMFNPQPEPPARHPLTQ